MRSASTVLLRTQSDTRLVALASAGHDRAFEAIVERYRRPLLRACRRILPEARAEDALQHALVTAWAALRRGDDVRDLRPWLYRIARNTALNQLREAGSDLDELVDTLAASGDPAEEIERRALVHRTLVAIAALPDRQRDALLRTAIAGEGQDELARDLGISSTAVRQLVHRARVSVRTAATVVVPWPLAAWLAAAGTRGEPRIAELVAAGAAGGSAWAAKAGTVAVIAGSAVTAPAVIDHPEDRDVPPTEGIDAAEVAEAEPAATAAPVAGHRAHRAAAPVAAPPELERIAAAGGPKDGGEKPRASEPRMSEGRHEATPHAPSAPPPPPAPSPAAPVRAPAAPTPAAATPTPTPTATPTPAPPAEEPPAAEETGEDRPAEPETPPPGDETGAGEEPAGSGEEPAPSAP
jgi:RNA polymerase sigma factor (sigma-70 family)